MNPAAVPLTTLLGPRGAAALMRARRVLAEATADTGGAALQLAGWTVDDWTFRFALPAHGRAVVVSIPHDGGPCTVVDAGADPEPLPPGGSPAP